MFGDGARAPPDVGSQILMAPGGLILLRDNGALEIKRGTTLAMIVSEWEAVKNSGAAPSLSR